jgi:hypothetical protein
MTNDRLLELARQAGARPQIDSRDNEHTGDWIMSIEALKAFAGLVQEPVEPTMFWWAEDPEENRTSLTDLVDEEWGYGSIEVGDELKVLRAAALPPIRIRIVAEPGSTVDNTTVTYEVIEEPK